MRTDLRMLGLIRPYLPQVGLSILFTIVFSVLSSFSVMMIEPFLRTLFADNVPVAAGHQAQPAPAAAAAVDPSGGTMATPPAGHEERSDGLNG
jgi:hypothetical protein